MAKKLMHAKFDEAMTALAKASRDYTAYERPGGWEFPALAYERATGISGIGQGYAIPGDVHPTVAHKELAVPGIKAAMAERMISVASGMGERPSGEQVAAFVQEKANAFSDMSAARPNAGPGAKEPMEYRVARREFEFAQAFQKVHNLTGGSMESALQAALPTWQQQEKAGYSKMLDGLTARNPSLAALPVDRSNPEQVKNVVDGALSGYNPADIKAFSLDGQTSRLDAIQQPNWLKNEQALQQMIPGQPLEWIPAVETQEKIIGQLREKQRQAPSPAAALRDAAKAAAAIKTPVRRVQAVAAPSASPATPSSSPQGRGAGRS